MGEGVIGDIDGSGDRKAPHDPQAVPVQSPDADGVAGRNTRPGDSAGPQSGAGVDDVGPDSAAGPQSGAGVDGAGPDGGAEPYGRSARQQRMVVGVLVGVGALVLLLDVLTKQLAVADLADRPPVRVLGGAVYLLLTRNSGAAFSLGTHYTWVFPVITLGVVAGIVWYSPRLRSLPWAVAFGLILGGALGNLADRIFRAPGPFVGHVVDFVSLFDRNGMGFPVFNLADSALCCGFALALLLELTGRRRDGDRVRHSDT